MRCGLLGERLGHSYSPRLHALLGEYSYELFEVAPEGLEAFLRSGAFDALNVTIPYKKAVMPFCAELSENAGRIGSVNTLLRWADGSLFGDNTDFDGFSWLLERNGGVCAGEKALVLGAGGASQTVQAVLRAAGAEVVVISRRGEDNYDTLERHADATVLVNTTPVGMYPNNGASPLSLARLPKCRLVLDLIYNPARTALVLEAERRGLRCEGGLAMLVAQAKAAAERFTGVDIPDERCEALLRTLQNETENIILVGMPGSGKSSVGRAVAERLNRPFLDSDDVLAQRLGCDIPTFFAREGEEAFRAAETQVLRELGKRSGCVIATGGGCVTRAENYPALHQNGKIFRLERPTALLPTAGRPVSQATPLPVLYAARKPLYARFADKQINNGGALSAAVDAILEEVL